MLFKKELIEKIVAGQKTQTRRPMKQGEWFKANLETDTPAIVAGGRIKIQVGRDYAVCPGRGKQGMWWHPEKRTLHESPIEYFPGAGELIPLRIRITDIRREDVRNISSEDAIAEGFQSEAEFLLTWCGFYDKRISGLVQKDGVVLWVDGAGVPYASDVVDFGGWLKANRPAELYQAWAYTFEIV